MFKKTAKPDERRKLIDYVVQEHKLSERQAFHLCTLVISADQDLYAAKRNGRNRVEVNN